MKLQKILKFLMKFIIKLYNKTALIIAIEKENIEIIQILLADPKIDVNKYYILIYYYFNII